ncbi:MAG: prephenate dehydrogenase [Candidatus Omnitrophica bacterium]|nr:prephenate dehydrogenase [Candidatus Omnitrophota bacterium]
MFKKVAIIGVGLIGGSIGLALKKKRLAKEIVGVCRHKTSLARAKRKRAIDNGTLDYKDAVKGADLVILATPVNKIISIGKAIAPLLEPNCLVTDVGSTKEVIAKELEGCIGRRCSFVGSHPMAGSEKRGVAQARAGIFKGALCFVVKTSRTKKSALKRVNRLWRDLGCRVKVLSPQRHDQIVAVISHLPHLAAGQLVNAAKNSLSFAASGFLDSTRIAASDSEIWTDIFLTNKKAIMQVVNNYIRNLKRVSRLIKEEKEGSLRAECKKIKDLRDVLSR